MPGFSGIFHSQNDLSKESYLQDQYTQEVNEICCGSQEGIILWLFPQISSASYLGMADTVEKRQCKTIALVNEAHLTYNKSEFLRVNLTRPHL